MTDAGVFAADPGQTPLDPSEIRGLRISAVRTRKDLDEVESLNIAEAELWVGGQAAWSASKVLQPDFALRLHRRMFKDVWKWAGQYRTTEKNIGVLPYQVPVELRQHLDDARAWVEFGSYPRDEIAIRVKHRVVQVHVFSNGNGRHSRLYGDIVAMALGAPRFSWGASAVETGRWTEEDRRRRYLAGLRKADGHDLADLLDFARS